MWGYPELGPSSSSGPWYTVPGGGAGWLIRRALMPWRRVVLLTIRGGAPRPPVAFSFFTSPAYAAFTAARSSTACSSSRARCLYLMRGSQLCGRLLLDLHPFGYSVLGHRPFVVDGLSGGGLGPLPHRRYPRTVMQPESERLDDVAGVECHDVTLHRVRGHIYDPLAVLTPTDRLDIHVDLCCTRKGPSDRLGHDAFHRRALLRFGNILRGHSYS